MIGLKKMLQESAKLFDEAAEARKSTEMPSPLMYKNNWKGFKKAIDEYDPKIINLEKRHRAYIKKLSSNVLFVRQLLMFIEGEDETIQREAFFVIAESKNREMIEEMIKTTLSFSITESNTLYEMLGFVSKEAFIVLFECAKEIGFEQPQNNHNMTKNLLNYIAHFHLSDLTHYFIKLDNFPQVLQNDIIEMLLLFEEHKEFVLNTYKHKHSQIDGIMIFTLFMLCNEEEKALNALCQKDMLINQDSSVEYLLYLGDKSDGTFIGKIIREAFLSGEWKESGFSDRNYWLYQKLYEAYDISNPLFLEEMTPLLKELYRDEYNQDEYVPMYGEDPYFLLKDMLWEQLSEIDRGECVKKYKSKLSENELVYQCWREYSKNDMRKKFLLGNDFYSVQMDLLATLAYGMETLGYPHQLAEYRIITGADDSYLFSRSTYYSTTKAQTEKFLQLIESHKENYEAGRWIRLGRYVDVPYTPIESDNLKE